MEEYPERETDTGIRTLTLLKGDKIYCFKYETGEENLVVAALTNLVGREGFEWRDAKILAEQLGRQIGRSLKDHFI